MAESVVAMVKKMAGDPDGPGTMIYRTYRIDPKSANLAFIAGKYAALSLRALMVDPGAFAIAYKTEAAYSPEKWMERVSRPNVHIFICVAHPPALSPEDLRIENGTWVGMITQIGSTPKHDFWLRESGTDEPLDDDLETHWHQTATWVDPAYRGHGIARQIIDTAVSFAAASIAGNVRQARVRAFTSPENETSQRLYGKAGFPVVGRCTIAEAMVCNGNAGIPFYGRTDWPTEIFDARMGLMMERVVKKSDVITD